MTLGPTEIFAALAGATATGVWQVLDRVFARRRRAEAILVAIATEVMAIVDLIDHQNYVQSIAEVVDRIRNRTWDGSSIIIDIRSNYFGVFDSLSSELGELKPCQISKIVAFYSYSKSAIDSTRPDGPHVGQGITDDGANNIVNLYGTFIALRSLGDDIVAMPKVAIPPSLATAQ